MVSQKSFLIYVEFKGYIIKGINLAQSIPENTITATKLKRGLGLGSHKKSVSTQEPKNPRVNKSFRGLLYRYNNKNFTFSNVGQNFFILWRRHNALQS